MKPRLIAGAVLGVVALLWLLWPKPGLPEAQAPPPDPAALATQPGESLALQADAAEVFRRAFWRQPSPQDIITNAERREWSETSGQQLRRWQWFIEVTPDPELLAVLRDKTKFGLVLTPAPSPWSTLAPPPRWFPPRDSFADYQVYQSPRGGMTLFHQPEKNLLFACDEGHGMASPVIGG